MIDCINTSDSRLRHAELAGSFAGAQIRLDEQTILAAVQDGRSWLLDLATPRIIPLPDSRLAVESASVSATLIEGALAVGLAQAGPARVAKPITLFSYVRWLVGNYLFAGQTPGLLRLGAHNLEALGQAELAALALEKAEEETGHAHLAYLDLESLGLPAQRVIDLIAPPSANAFAARLREHAVSQAPIAMFGFSYCLERMALERDGRYVAKVRATLPPGSRGWRFLKVHSGTGSDRDHVLTQLAMFERLCWQELTTVVRATFDTARMLATQFHMDSSLSDEDVRSRLDRARIDTRHLVPECRMRAETSIPELHQFPLRQVVHSGVSCRETKMGGNEDAQRTVVLALE